MRFEQVEVTSKEEFLRGEQSFIDGLPRAVCLIGGPRDGEIVDGGADDYAEVTTYGEFSRTAIWAPRKDEKGLDTP